MLGGQARRWTASEILERRWKTRFPSELILPRSQR
jgi:hypothetical protein